MQIKPIKTRIFQENENLFEFVIQHLKKIPEDAVLVITSKIVALAEGRTAEITDEKSKIKLIKAESEVAIETKHVWLTVKDGMLMASAGIDESNSAGKLVLLPRDSFRSASVLRKKLLKHYNLRNLGILITDSRTIPLRAGVSGVALGYAGFRGVRDYRNTPDIFGRKMQFSRTDIADSLATAATLVMGEGSEQTPLGLITKAPVEFKERVNRRELHIDPEEDMYRPFFTNLK